MTLTRHALATLCWITVPIILIAAALQHPNVVGIAGIVCALSATAWGLIKWLQDRDAGAPATSDESPCPICDHPFGELQHACIGASGYPVTFDRIDYPPRAQTVIRGGQAPVWPLEAGAPE